jgi:hypothetical protein
MTDTTGLRGRQLAEAVLDVVENQPEKHDQEIVVCGTTACIAGWAAALHHGALPGDRTDAVRFRWNSTDEEAYRLLFGEEPVNEAGYVEGFREFEERVFENPDNDSAIRQLRAMLDRMPAGATA